MWQITVASMTGRKADGFLSNVQQAATGHPWYSHAKPVVGLLSSCYLITILIIMSRRL